MRGRLARIHQRGDDGQLAPIDLELPQEPEFEMGGGGLYSTAADYLAFVRMMLNEGKANGNRILKPETVAEIFVRRAGLCWPWIFTSFNSESCANENRLH